MPKSNMAADKPMPIAPKSPKHRRFLSLRRRPCFAALLLGALLAAGTPRIAPAKENPTMRVPTEHGEWWQQYGDRRFSGRARMPGAIDEPAIRWRHPLGGREAFYEVALDAEPSASKAQNPLVIAARIPFAQEDVAADRKDDLFRRWGVGPVYLDLDGDGVPQPVGFSGHRRVGDFLPGSPGMEQAAVHTTYWSFYTRKDGDWVEKWSAGHGSPVFVVNPLIGDFNNDGRLEFVTSPWYHVIGHDLETGEEVYKVYMKNPEQESGRNYGYVGAHDLDGSGTSEFVVLADFENHVDVMGWKDGELKVLWQKLIERGIGRKTTILKPGVGPVRDIDGDGRKEIVVCIYNATGDERWHVIAWDGMTGEVRLDLPGLYLVGMADATGDGLPDLFCTETEAYSLPTESPRLSIHSFARGEAREIWSLENAGFQRADVQDLPLNENSHGGANDSLHTLLADAPTSGAPNVFVTRRLTDRATGRIALTFWQCRKDAPPVENGSLEGPRLEALAIGSTTDGRPGVLVRGETPDAAPGHDAALRFFDAVPELAVSRTTRPPRSTPAVGRLRPDDPPTVIVEGPGETQHALRFAPRGEGVERLWVTALRGFDGPVLAGLQGDGTLTLLGATRYGEHGCARLVAVDPDGREIWHRDFPKFQGPPPPWNVGGFIRGCAAHLRQADRETVWATFRRNSMHSDQTSALDGRTGDNLWLQTNGGGSRGFGGQPLAAFDWHGDGLDDLFNTYPDLCCFHDGRTGDLIAYHDIRELFGGDAGYSNGAPLVADILTTGTEEVVLVHENFLGLVDREGKVVWSHGPSKRNSRVLTADPAGSGETCLFNVDDGRLLCLRAATGEPAWEFALPDGGGNIAVADINGDGRDECLVTQGHALTAIGATPEGDAGRLLWRIELPADAGAPAIADVDGDGRVEIVLVCSDGFVYGIDGGSGGKP